MAQADPRPEEVIRDYLETQKGPVEAHVLHLKETFEVEDLSQRNLSRIRKALEKANVHVEPPLKEVPPDGWLTLSLQAKKPDSASRANGSAGEKAIEARQPFLKRLPGVKRSGREAKRLGESSGGAGEVAAARDALGEALSRGEGAEEVERARSALEGAASDPSEVLAALDELLARFRSELDERLKESGGALSSAKEARGEMEGRLATLDNGLRSIVQREEARNRELAEGGKRGERLCQDFEKRIAAAREAFRGELGAGTGKEEIQARFAELTAAAHRLIEIRQTEASEVAKREQALAETASRVDGARVAVEEALSDSAIRDQLEARVSGLRLVEEAERKARESLEQVHNRIEAELKEAAARLHAAEEQVSATLADGASEAALLQHFKDLGSAEGESLRELEKQLTALMRKLHGHEEQATELWGTAVEMRESLQPDEGDPASAAASLDALSAGNRRATEALNAVEQLLRIRDAMVGAMVESRTKAKEAEHRAEQRVSAASSRLERLEEKLRTRGKELERVRSEARRTKVFLERSEEGGRKQVAELSRRVEEAERALEQRTGELERARSDGDAARSETQQRLADLAQRLQEIEVRAQEQASELEQARSEGTAMSGRVAALSGELEQTRAAFDAAELQAHEAKARLKEVTGEAELMRANQQQADEAQQRLVALEQSRAELEQRVGEYEAQLGLARAEAEQTQEHERNRAVDEHTRSDLELKLSEQADELERVRREERVAREEATRLARELDDARAQLEPRRAQRKAAKEGQIVDAIESVRRALLDPTGEPESPTDGERSR